VSGLIKHGRWGHLATLPSDCRPKGRLIFNMNNHQHSARVDVLTNGQIKWVTGGKSHHWISLTGITIHRKSKGWTKRFCCTEGPGGKAYTFHKNGPKATANFNKAKYANNAAGAQKFCLSWGKNKGKKAGQVFSAGRCVAGKLPGSVRSLSLQNSWKPYGHGYEAPSTTKYGSLCVVSGLIKRNGMKNPLLTLPADCRPNKRVIFSLNNHQYQERVDVLTNGQVHYVAGTWRHNWLNLDGIHFAVSGQHSLSTQSGWKGYGGSYKSPTYTKTGSVCEVEGLVKHGRWGQPMVTLPGNCRPKKRLIFNMNNHKKSCRVDVQTNGRVTWHAGGKDHHWVSLGGIMFSTHAGSTLSLRNHWKNYGGSYGSATVAKTGSLCLVSGLIKHGRWGHLATLPSDCRPKGRLIFNMNNHQHSARVDVLTNGQIKWVTGGKSHHWISLTGITIHRKHH